VPIEFNCSQCRHRLRTPDDSAGKQSRCPQCGHIQLIPPAGSWDAVAPDARPAPPTNPFDAAPTATAWQPADNPFSDAARPVSANPYATPYSASAAIPPDPGAATLPGAMLIAVAVTNMVLLGLGLAAGVVTVLDQGMEDDDLLAFIFLGFSLAVQFLILWGGINMVRRRGYAIAMAGTIAAIAPVSMCWCLHLPIGLWSLAVLTKKGMSAAFASRVS